MFGDINPSVKNELVQALRRNNEWTGIQTFTKNLLGTTPVAVNKYRNTTPAALGAQQVSPSTEWEGQGWKTNSVAGSQAVNFRTYALPVQGTVSPLGNLKTEYSINGGAYTTLFELLTTGLDGVIFPLARMGAIESSVNNSSTIGTLQNVLLTNPSGSKTNVGFKFASIIKAGFQVDAGGTIDYRGSQHNFFTGNTAESASQVVQIYSGGIYNGGGSYNGGPVTAGLAETSATVRLSTYGGFAGKGVLVTSATYTYGDEMVVYGDGDAAFECTGTATACSTYSSEGTCNAHSLAGCNWFAGNSCGDFSGTSEGTCEGNAGCTWEESPCSTANNTDQSTCESQDDTYGGNCSWDTSYCPSITDESTCNSSVGCSWNDTCSGYTDQGSCETNSCTWNYTDCSSNFFDESSCNAQSGCSWDGATCNGQYNTSCVGGNCSGNLCTGNYATGNCSGVYGALCQGTASCANLTDDGSVACAAEAGCSWLSGATYTYPVSSIANRGNVSRFYYTKNVGASGNITVQAGAGDTLEAAVSLAPGESILHHHFSRTANCSVFTSSATCGANVGCSWLSASCSDFGADEATCNAQSGNGCSWYGDSCEGTYSGSGGSCSGTYSISKKWYELAKI